MSDRKRTYKILKDVLDYAKRPYLLLCAIITISFIPLLYNLYIASLQYSLTNSISNNGSMNRWMNKIIFFIVVLLVTEIVNRLLRYYVSSQKNKISSCIKEKVFDISINKPDSQLIDKNSLTTLTKYSLDIVNFIDVYIKYSARLISGLAGLIYAAIYVDLNFFVIISMYALLVGGFSILRRDEKSLSNDYYNSMEQSEQSMQKMYKAHSLIKSLKIESDVITYIKNKLCLTEAKERRMINYENDREQYKKIIDLSSILVIILSLVLLNLGKKSALRLISIIWLINPIYNFIPNYVMLNEMSIRYKTIIEKANFDILKKKLIKNSGETIGKKHPICKCSVDVENIYYFINEKTVIDGITLNLNEGDFCLIKGSSGSGKTTLLKLIMGIYKPTKGRILVNGSEPNLYSDEYSYVDQETFLFPGSIRDNLASKNTNITDEEIWRVLSLLDISDRIHSLGGLDTIVENHDTRLSGGERQRLCIARALLKPSSILILDEATSGLDKINKTKVYDATETYRLSGKIIIEVAHKFSLDRYNKIIEL